MTISQASSQTAPLLSPEEIAVRAGQQIPYLHFPQRANVFSQRERRLRERAASHAMRDFLLFAAELAHAQHQTLQTYPTVSLPDQQALLNAAHAGLAPMPAATWPRDPQWRVALRSMLTTLLPRLNGNPAQAGVRAVQTMSDQELELQADRLLNNIMFGLDMATAPIIAAGLQVYWTHMVVETQAAHASDKLAPLGRVADVVHCPCCGSLPTVSISRVDGDGNYRYLHCSLCSSQWHMVRIKCTHCESTKGIHYHGLQAAVDVAAGPMSSGISSEKQTTKQAIEAETCDECHHYLKIVRMERDIAVEPAADDLASVTLDLLVSEAGYQRHGVNLMLLFGDPDVTPDGTDIADDGGGGR